MKIVDQTFERMAMIAQKKREQKIKHKLKTSIVNTSAKCAGMYRRYTHLGFFFFLLKANLKHWKAHINTEETNLNDYKQMYNWALWTLHETYLPKSIVLIGLNCHYISIIDNKMHTRHACANLKSLNSRWVSMHVNVYNTVVYATWKHLKMAPFKWGPLNQCFFM